MLKFDVINFNEFKGIFVDNIILNINEKLNNKYK